MVGLGPVIQQFWEHRASIHDYLPELPWDPDVPNSFCHSRGITGGLMVDTIYLATEAAVQRSVGADPHPRRS